MEPFFFITFVFLTICTAYIFYKWGWISLVIFAPVLLIPVFLNGYSGGVSLYSLPVIAGTAGGYCFRKSSGLDFFITVSAILFAVVFTSDFYIMKKVKGYDFIDAGAAEVISRMNQSKDEMDREFYPNVPESLRQPLKDSFNNYLIMIQDSRWIQFAKDMIPFTAFLYSLLISGFSFLLMKKVFMKKQGEAVRSLELFRLNDYFIFSLIAGWGSFILLNEAQFPVIKVIALNIALAASVLYFIQALGIIKFIILKRGIPVILLPLLLIILMILGAPVLMFAVIVLIGIGTLDLWGDFRKLVPEIERNIKE